MFAKISVKKPYTVLVGVVLVIVLGVVALMKSKADLLPNMNLPYAIIITTYVGAAPEEVEKEVTAPIEAQMATTSNIKNVSSTSSNSYSLVILEYEQTAKMDSVVIEIQQKLDQVAGTFPSGVSNPMILQIDPTMLPVVVASADVEGMDQLQISDYAENTLVPNIESVEGVASVSLIGQAKENISIVLDEDKIEEINKKVIKEIDKKFGEARADLDEADQEIKEAQKKLDDGKDELAEKISDGANEIINGKIEAAKGEHDIALNIAKLQETQKTLNTSIDGLNKLYSGAKQVDEALPQLNNGIAMYEAGILQGLVGTPLEGMTIEQLKENFPQYIPADYTALVAQRDKLVATKAELDATIAGMKSQFTTYGITLNTYKDIPAAIQKLNESLGQVNSGIAALNDAQKKVDEGQITLDDAYIALNSGMLEGIFEIADAQTQLTLGQAQIDSGFDQIDAAYDAAIEQADVTKILTVDMINNLIMAQNFEMPAGYIQEGETSYLIQVGDKVKSVEDLENLILLDLGMDGIEPIYMRDVATVTVTNNAADSYARINGNPAIFMSIEKQTGYSTGEVADRILERFDSLEAQEEGLNLAVLMNQGVYIDLIIESVLENMLIGALLAIIVLIVFLKDWKSTFIIACSIPLSVIFAIVFMYFTGISLNIISLSGLALGIGMLVDNSIVVIENIYRLRKEGLTVKKASVIGTSQVGGAIIASTLTTVCVFAPIVFTNGITRSLFVDLALTVVYTLGASLIVALTFVPMMSSVMLKDGQEKETKLFDKIRDWYGNIMRYVLRYKALVLVLVVVLLGVSIYAGFSRGFSFLDMEMEADQITLTVSANDDEYLSEDELREKCDELCEILLTVDGLETIGMMTGGSGTLSMLSGSDAATVYLVLDPETKRKSSEIANEINEKTKDMDCKVESSLSSMDFSAYFGEGLSIQVKGRDMQKLQNYALQVAEIVENTEGCVDVDPGLGDTTTSLTLHVNKEKAMEYQMTVAQIFQLVYAKMADTTSKASISTDVKDYDIYVMSEEQAEATIQDIKGITFTYKDPQGEKEDKVLALAPFVTIEEGTSLDSINRIGQTRYLTVSAKVADGYNVTQLSNKIQKDLSNMHFDEGYSYKMAGEDETIMDAMKQLGLMLILAVIFIYLVMVAQFQSLLSPFIIMFTIPLAFTGGFFALFFTGNDVSVIGAIGFIMLAGIIVNNGIVMVDYINQLRGEGWAKKDAICETCKARLRPILMTTLTTVISMSTLALGLGSGSEMIQPMAIVMIGGLVYGTLLTLFVVPCLYDIFNSNKSMKVNEYGERIEEEQAAVVSEGVN